MEEKCEYLDPLQTESVLYSSIHAERHRTTASRADKSLAVHSNVPDDICRWEKATNQAKIALDQSSVLISLV